MFKKINNQGFTMLELIVVIGLFILFSGAITEMMIWGNHSKDVIFEQLSKQNDGRNTIQNFLNDLRRASYSSIGAYPLELATAQEIVFYSNVDSDSWKERVHYFISGTTLTYNSVNEVSTIVANDLNNTTTLFLYYSQNYDGSSNTSSLSFPINISQVRLIEIKLWLDLKPNVSPAPLFIEGKTALRNLKSN